MGKLSPRALAVAAERNRAKAIWACALAIVAATSLWLSAGGFAAGSGNRIDVTRPATIGFSKTEPYSPPGDPITFAPNTTLSCAPQPNGQPSTCTALATLVPDEGPLKNTPLATYARRFTSDQPPITLKFGLSQHALDLLYRRGGDPRCTVTVTIVNDASTAGQTGTGPQSAADSPGVGAQSTAPARSFTVHLDVPTG